MEVVLERTSRGENNCWNWTGSIQTTGYGAISWNGNMKLAHRMSYEDFYGEIDNDLHVDHLCRNKSCVNPTHLELVTQRENTLRGIGLGAKNSKKTHCKRGHKFDHKNTKKREYKLKTTGKLRIMRSCRLCLNLLERGYRLKRKENESGN